MAFADPQKVKVGATEYTLPRVKTEGKASEYSNDDSTVDMTISTQETRKDRLRHTVRLDKSKITTNPYDTTQNVDVSSSCYLVIDRPIAGFTTAEQEEIVKGLVEFLSASTYAAVKKVLGRES